MKQDATQKALAPANDQLQSRPATVYEDEAKRDEEMQVESSENVCPPGYYERKQAVQEGLEW